LALANSFGKPWLRRRIEKTVGDSLRRVYEHIGVDPGRYLMHLRMAHGLPVQSYQGVVGLRAEQLDPIAEQTVRAAMKMAALEGAGFGLGGILTVLPDLGVLSGITLRMIQKLSLIYGFEFTTDEEVAELWLAIASAAGVDISRELLEKTVLSRFVERIIQRVAAQASADIASRAAARIVPILSSALGAALNYYYFVRAWGARVLDHFRERHNAERERMAQAAGRAAESELHLSLS
jgi:hypothetical protein